MENHAKYGDSIYFQDGASLYVNLFIASTLNWAERGVTIKQSTSFPEEPRTRLSFQAKRPAAMTLKLRHPAWAETVSVKVNGRPVEVASKPGSYLEIQRTWRNGDTVELETPMRLRTEPLPGNPDTVAVLYGPIVLAGVLGRQGIAPGADIIVNERTYGAVLNDPIEVPTLAGDASSILASIKPAPNQPLTFVTEGIGRPKDVTLVPYYRVAHERYNLYWQCS
jgi:DUF1680 family protein